MGDSEGDGVTRWLSHGFQGLQRSGSMRRLELISGLRTRGIGDHIDLPQLVVSGDQSTGKSSVLEGITGLPFPRQDGLCTRFATEITTEHTDITSLEITASIIPANHRDGKVYDHLRAYERTLNSLDELPAVIAEVGELMGLKGYGSREAGPAFGQDVLRINLRGKTGLNLTVVDLPGIIQVPNEEQDDGDVETIHGLVDSYAANPRTIILAVVQAGNDIANQPIIQKSKKFDKAGERTIGVITKPDLINDKTQSRIAALAKNEDTTKLQLGFFLVKNPSPSELEAGINPQERERMELCYFSSPPWKDQGLERSRTGVIALRTYLQDLLDRHTERELPKVREEVRKLLKSTGKSIESLGEERPNVEQMRMFLSRLAMRFHNITRSALIGDYDSAEPDFFFLDSEHPVRLRALVHTLNHHFSNEMRIRGETLKVVGEHDDNSHDDIDIHDHLRNGNCSEQLPVTEENFADWVKRTYSRTRGRELPGNYNHVLLAELFHSQSKRWAALSFQHVDKVYEQIKIFVKASVEHVARDERVRLEVYEKVNQRLDNNMSSAKAELGRLLEDEKQQPITYNHYYTDNVQKARRDTSQDLIETIIKDTATEEYHGAMHISNNGLDLGRLLAALKRRVTVDMDDQACTEARAGLKAYYKVARKTFVDNVCKQVIERHLLQPLPSLFSPAAVAGYRDDELIRIAAESPQVSSERRRLQDLQANLMTSLAELG